MKKLNTHIWKPLWMGMTALLYAVQISCAVESTNNAVSLSSSPGAEKASLIVHAREKSKYPVPRYITGKFCEHLYFNITNGMDAQILRNPTFSDYPFRTGQMSPDGVATFHFDRDEIARRIRNGAGRWGWPESEIEALIKSRNEVLACWWTKLGPVDASPDTGPHSGLALSECTPARRARVSRSGPGCLCIESGSITLKYGFVPRI